MDGATLFRVISLIPERTARAQSGSAFAGGAAAISRFLNWLSPLNPISREDQQALGLREPGSRPAHAEEQEGEAMDEAEEAGSDAEGTSIAPGGATLPYVAT